MPNTVALDASGSVAWNGKPVARDKLGAHLRAVPSLNPVPPMVLSIDARANCEAAASVRREIDEALNCKASGLCGEGDGDWSKRFPYLNR